MKLSQAFAAVVAAVAAVGLSVLPAIASAPVAVPEPGSLSLLSSALVAGIVGYRWFRGR